MYSDRHLIVVLYDNNHLEKTLTLQCLQFKSTKIHKKNHQAAGYTHRLHLTIPAAPGCTTLHSSPGANGRITAPSGTLVECANDALCGMKDVVHDRMGDGTEMEVSIFSSKYSCIPG